MTSMCVINKEQRFGRGFPHAICSLRPISELRSSNFPSRLHRLGGRHETLRKARRVDFFLSDSVVADNYPKRWDADAYMGTYFALQSLTQTASWI